MVSWFLLSSRFPFLKWIRPGDLVYLNAAAQPLIIVNSQRAAADLFDRRAGIYSDRPPLIVACDIMTGGLFFALSRYGDV
jgi:hypothetical protein